MWKRDSSETLWESAFPKHFDSKKLGKIRIFYVGNAFKLWLYTLIKFRVFFFWKLLREKIKNLCCPFTLILIHFVFPSLISFSSTALALYWWYAAVNHFTCNTTNFFFATFINLPVVPIIWAPKLKPIRWMSPVFWCFSSTIFPSSFANLWAKIRI